MAARRKVRFGIIGLGLMGREFGSAIARWCHLLFDGPVPELAGICDTNIDVARAGSRTTFRPSGSPPRATRTCSPRRTSRRSTAPCPTTCTEKLYVDIISAGKHLMGEKPFGIDKSGERRDPRGDRGQPEGLRALQLRVPLLPRGAAHHLVDPGRARSAAIIEVRSGFHHSSDMDVTKPLNWKRMVEVNGEYGCMGDLGIHTQHVPFRMGWIPKTVHASLSKIVTERPDGKGGMAPCRTWDNATLSCAVDHPDGYRFPLFLETKRMAPGQTNTWYLEVDGLKASVRFSTRDPKTFYYSDGGREGAVLEPARPRLPPRRCPAITGGIFEFGFSDSLLQMWAAFLLELDQGKPPVFGCFTPEETRISHALHTAALESKEAERRAVRV